MITASKLDGADKLYLAMTAFIAYEQALGARGGVQPQDYNRVWGWQRKRVRKAWRATVDKVLALAEELDYQRRLMTKVGRNEP